MSEHLRVSYIESTFYTLFKILKITHKTCRHYLKRNKPRLGDIKKLSWSHSASEGQSWDSNPRLCWFHPQVLAGFTLLAPSSQTCQTRREFSGDLAFVGLRDEPPGDFTWELIPCPLAVPHLSKQERVHLPFLLKKYTSRWGVCVCVCAPWGQGHLPHSFYSSSTQKRSTPKTLSTILSLTDLLQRE